MRNRILITRPQNEADITGQAVRKLGFVPLIEPVLSIETLRAVWPSPEGFAGLVLTSGNAIPSIPEAWVQSGLPVFSVGDATAARAREAGFGTVVSAAGDAAALQAMLEREVWPEGAQLLHPCGVDVAKILDVAGCAIERLPVYRTKARENFSGEVLDSLDQGRILTALFYSPRSGSVFADLVAKQGRTPCLNGINALCLSAPVVQSVGHLPWAGVRQAARPDQAAMLGLLAELAKETGSIDGR